MKDKQATLFGATGLIGSYLLKIILEDDYFSKVIVVTRKPVLKSHPKMEVLEIDFSDQKAIHRTIKNSAVVFSAIGTTQAHVRGDKEVYRSIDFGITYGIALACKKEGIDQFIFVSSSGADPTSTNFYISLKGEIDEAILNLKLASALIFRPSLLLGRRNEFRFGERIAQLIMPLLSFLMPPKYRPVKAMRVAALMVNASKWKTLGNRIIENQEMFQKRIRFE